MKFHGILAGVGVGRAGDYCHALVNDPALLVVEGSENQTAVGRFHKGFSAVQCKYLIRDRDAPVTRQADDANGGNRSAGGYGGDNVGHKKPPLFVLQKCQRVALIGNEVHQHVRAHNGHVFLP